MNQAEGGRSLYGYRWLCAAIRLVRVDLDRNARTQIIQSY